jgi:hypothetical protein
MLCKFALRIAPPRHAVLARAMAVELDHASDADAVGFAIGCLTSTVRWRLTEAETVVRGARWIIAAGTTGLALACLWVGHRLSLQGDHQVSQGLVLVALFYVGATILTLKVGLTALAQYAAVGLTIVSLALLWRTSAHGAVLQGDYWLALMIEELCLLSLMICAALGTHGFARRLNKTYA